jgi:hypothetical protein
MNDHFFSGTKKSLRDQTKEANMDRDKFKAPFPGYQSLYITNQTL